MNSGVIEGAILLGAGDDQIINEAGGEIYGTILLEDGDDLFDGRAVCSSAVYMAG